MFLNQLSEDEQKLYLRMAAVLTAIDNPVVDIKAKKTIMRIDSEIDLLTTSICGESILRDYETKDIIKTAYEDFESMLFAVDKDADPDEPPPLEEDKRLTLAAKLARRYIREADLVGILPASRKVMVFELYSVGLADGEITDSEQALIHKLAKTLQVEDFISHDLQESAKSINRALVEALAIISE